MVGGDHFHQLWLDSMPQFLVGKAPSFEANLNNEECEFGLPRMTLRGQEDLASHILRNGLDLAFDLAFSCELRIDHSINLLDHQPAAAGCPADRADLYLHPRPADASAPAVRRARPGFPEMVESWPSDLRVAIIGTGHLSLELGGPRQFGPHGPDPDFDRKAVEWIAISNLNDCLAEVSLDSLHAPGNATPGFMDFMLMMGGQRGCGRRSCRHARPVAHHGGVLHLVSQPY
jgi:protocatechuate 4,5-dioxygenase beta chain